MKSFKKYLERKKYGTTTINRKVKHLLRYEKWLEKMAYVAKEIDYRKGLDYLSGERSRGIAESTLYHYFTHVKQYYDYLKSKEEIRQNPFTNIHLKKRINQGSPLYLQDLLKPDQLHQIYQVYQSNPRLNFKNQILLSLLIYQGIAVAELPYLKVNHLDLEKGKILIPSSSMYQSRTLDLAAPQILALAKYLADKKPNDRVIEYSNASQGSNSRSHLCQQLQKEILKHQLSIDFINLRQIRRSVIAQWVKRYNLRQAQYKAGHRSVYTTEQYQLESIEELIEQVSKYHPLEQGQSKE